MIPHCHSPRATRLRPLPVAAVLLCLIASAARVPAQDGKAKANPSPAEARAEAALEPLVKRFPAQPSDRDKLGRDLRAFRLAHPGTRAAVKAAAMLSQLPSPLDKLNPADIPPLERFDWQPKELVGILGEHRGRHGTAVSCVAYSTDGKFVVSGGGGLVRLWDAHTYRLLAVVGTGSVTSIALARDNKNLAVGTAGGTVYVWNVTRPAAPALRFTAQPATSAVYGVSFAPDHKTLAAGCYDNTTHVYDISGKAIKEISQFTGHTKGVSAVAFSPDGKTLATGSYDLTVRLWAVDKGRFRERALLAGHPNYVTALAFTPRGGLLASASADGTLRLWAMPGSTKPKPRVVLEPKAGLIYGLSFSSTGNTIALACADNTVRLWTLGGRPRERHKLAGHAGAVTGVAYSPDNRLLATGSADWTVRSWDLTRPKPVERFKPWSHLSHVYSASFAPDGKSVVTGSYDTIIRVWDTTKVPLKTRSFLKGDGVQVYCVAYSPSGETVAASGASTKVRQWDAKTGRDRPSCVGHPTYVNDFLYGPDGRQILTRSDKTLFLFDAVRGREVRRYNGHETLVHCLAWSPDGRLALSGSGTYLLDAAGKHVLKNGSYVYKDCLLQVWDVVGGSERHTIKAYKVPIYSAGFSADGRVGFSGGYEPKLRRWDLVADKPEELTPLKGGSGYVHSMLATPDGKTLITRGLDSQIIFWDVARGKRLPRRAWSFHENLGGMALSADSRHLAVCLATGVVYILRLAPPPEKPAAFGATPAR